MGNFGNNKSTGQLAADTALVVTVVALLCIIIGATSQEWGLAQFGLVILGLAVVLGIFGLIKK